MSRWRLLADQVIQHQGDLRAAAVFWFVVFGGLAVGSVLECWSPGWSYIFAYLMLDSLAIYIVLWKLRKLDR